MDLAACHLSVAYNLEVAYRFLGSWWNRGLNVPGCSTSVKISEDIFILSLAGLYFALRRWQGIEVLYNLMLYYNNPTRCSCAQSVLFHCRVTLHVSGAFHTHHQKYIDCICSLRYRSYIGAATFLQRGPVQTRPRWGKVAAKMNDLYRRL